ncbi:MAG: DUF3630 family protein [Psychrobium sp.]|nr:DUF3630 family protein [Psychrobium sp.]
MSWYYGTQFSFATIWLPAMPDNNFSFKINSTIAQAGKQPSNLYIDGNVTWDNFPAAASQLSKLIDATIVGKDIGADLHRWALDFEGCRLYLHFEEISSSFWLELDRSEDQDNLDYIATLIGK